MSQRYGGIVGKDYDAAKQTTTTFTSNGIFTPHTTQDVSFLCVGGGGAGSGSDAGSGGGGAGGYRSSFNSEILGGSDSNTKLLIHSDNIDGQTDFNDSSPTGHIITAYGDIHHETDQKKFGTTAIDFDGTGDYLTIPAHDDWDFGTGPYTIECWIKTSADSGWIINQANSDTGIRFCVGSNGSGSTSTIQMNEQVSNGDYNLNGSTEVGDGAWHHIAVTRGAPGSYTKIYVDGTLDATGNQTNRNFDNDNIMYIGTRYGHGGNYFNGYIDELRISKSQRYTGNFTVPDGPEEAPLALTKGTDYQITVGDGGVGDDETHHHYGHNPQRELSETSRGFGMGHDSAIGPYADSYTKLMIQSYTSDGSTTFTDLSDSTHTITVNGNTHHEEDQHNAFHPTAIYFDGTGDYLQLPTSSDWAMGAADFTVECWVRQDASPGYNADIFDTRVSSRDETTGFAVGIRNNGSFYIYCNGDKPVSSAGLISAETWYHLAVVRHSGKIILFLDGDQKSSYSSATQTFTNTQLKIGRRGDTDANPFKGYLDDIRVSKGVARYISTASGTDNTIYDTVNRIISYGGGRAGSQNSGAGSWSGASGGGGTYTSAGAAVSVLGQGNAGGLAVHFGGSGYGGGGGGGASAVGGPSSGSNSGGSGDVGGAGGAGRASTITGSSVTYAGGGGGGHRLAMTNAAEPGAGGAGGGGAGQGGGTHGTDGTGGTQGDGVDGTANTGGGGGGSGGQNQSQYGRISDRGGDGGSGIVIMYEPAANSGVWNMDDVFRYVSDGKW